MNSSSTLWMGDIENWMDEDYIMKIFHKINVVPVKIKLMKDRSTGVNQGYCFVELANEDDAYFVLESYNGKHIVGTNKIFKLNWANYSSNRKNEYGISVPEYNIYVGNLNFKTNDEELKHFFRIKYPSVVSAKIICDPTTKLSKGYGFVKLRDYSEYLRAISEMNGKVLQSKSLKVNQASIKKNLDFNQNYKINSPKQKLTIYNSKDTRIFNDVHLHSQNKSKQMETCGYSNSYYLTQSNFLSETIPKHGLYLGHPYNTTYLTEDDFYPQPGLCLVDHSSTTSKLPQGNVDSPGPAPVLSNFFPKYQYEQYINVYSQNNNITELLANSSNSIDKKKHPYSNQYMYYYNLINVNNNVNLTNQYYASYCKYGHDTDHLLLETTNANQKTSINNDVFYEKCTNQHAFKEEEHNSNQ